MPQRRVGLAGSSRGGLDLAQRLRPEPPAQFVAAGVLRLHDPLERYAFAHRREDRSLQVGRGGADGGGVFVGLALQAPAGGRRNGC